MFTESHLSPKISSVSGLNAVPKAKLLDSMLRFGNIFELDFRISKDEVELQLEKFSSNWVQYNPYKPQIPRQGLSVTSLDGGLSGKPDLYSLREYAKREGVQHQETDFNALTPVYRGCPAIQPLIDYFYPHLGRTHFLRLNAGGYFPPHRDGAGLHEPDSFRILVPISNINRGHFVFLYGNNRFFFDAGSVYFVNTLEAHSLFSFSNNVLMLVLNVILNEETVAKVLAKLAV